LVESFEDFSGLEFGDAGFDGTEWDFGASHPATTRSAPVGFVLVVFLDEDEIVVFSVDFAVGPTEDADEWFFHSAGHVKGGGIDTDDVIDGGNYGFPGIEASGDDGDAVHFVEDGGCFGMHSDDDESSFFESRYDFSYLIIEEIFFESVAGVWDE